MHSVHETRDAISGALIKVRWSENSENSENHAALARMIGQPLNKPLPFARLQAFMRLTVLVLDLGVFFGAAVALAHR